jgi:deoxyribodipyrimidine photolyase-related protein
MGAWAERMEQRGHRVHRVGWPADGEAVAEALDRALDPGITRLHVADPEDDLAGRRLREFAARRGIELTVHPSPNFLTPESFLDRQLGGDRPPRMARFYAAQRRRLGILVDDDGSPAGGRWSFDADNRRRLPKGMAVPPAPSGPDDPRAAAALDWARRRFPEAPGEARLRWPLTHEAAESWFERFLESSLADFGAYEDAISREHAFVFHSAITPMLNLGLLDPAWVVRTTLDFAAGDERVPLNSLEGFVRQVIGWREFMRGIYRRHGRRIRTSNFWGFERRMPRAFYRADTGLPPVDDAIRRVLADGWCHHIERLMVLGNVMLLCRIHPDEVYRWFMELFVDAHDWVMVPNVYGMSQFADGGLFTTKPYLSGSNYIRKMSDHPRGDWCDTWDGLFWAFVGDHPEVFAGNPRMSMMARSWERMDRSKKTAHRRNAERFLAAID